MVARSFREAFEQLAGTLPDILMLGIGIAVFAWALSPVLSAAKQVTGVISSFGATTTPATGTAVGTTVQPSTPAGGSAT